MSTEAMPGWVGQFSVACWKPFTMLSKEWKSEILTPSHVHRVERKGLPPTCSQEKKNLCPDPRTQAQPWKLSETASGRSQWAQMWMAGSKQGKAARVHRKQTSEMQDHHPSTWECTCAQTHWEKLPLGRRIPCFHDGQMLRQEVASSPPKDRKAGMLLEGTKNRFASPGLKML